MNGVHSNAAGFRRWLEGRDAGPPPEQIHGLPTVTLGSGLGSDDELGPQLLLADLEVVERDAALGQVLVQCGELLEQARLVHLVGRGDGSACSLAAALSSFREMRSSIFALARSFLAWSRCNFPNVERARATVHSFPAAGERPGAAGKAPALPMFLPHPPVRWASSAPSGGGGI